MEEKNGLKNDFFDDKMRWDLLPMQEIEDIVRVYHLGAKKYAENSWQNVSNGFERYRAALMRHMMAYIDGERYDRELGVNHLASVAWNAIALLWYDKHGKGLLPGTGSGYIPVEKTIVYPERVHADDTAGESTDEVLFEGIEEGIDEFLNKNFKEFAK